MKILVTGATGGLGRLVIRHLLSRGESVVATSRNAIKAASMEFYDSVRYVPFDIGAEFRANLFDYFERPDAAIHLAWEDLNDYRNARHLSSTLEGHVQFANNLISNGLQDFTCIGTCYEYGLREGMLKETMSSSPVLPYPTAKDRLRKFLEERQEEISFNLKWLRIFYVFGETQGRKNLYSKLQDAITAGEKTFKMSGGEQVRDFLTPDSIASIIVRAALQSKVSGVINCCSGTPVRLKDFIEDYVRLQGTEMKFQWGYYPYADYEPMSSWGSVEKLRRIT